MDYSNPEFYINRELSWLEFNERVLEEAFDKTNPLLERLKFLAISASNLDEFFMIRIANIHNQVEIGYTEKDATGMTPEEQLKMISERAHEMTIKQYNCLTYSISPLLETNGIFFEKCENLNDSQLKFLDKYFKDTIYPVLTPMAIDESRPFPLLLNKSLNLGIRLKSNEIPDEGEETKEIFSVVQVPSILPRIIEVPTVGSDRRTFILLEQIIERNVQGLYHGYEINSVSSFRITRNADLAISEEETEDLLREIEKSIKRRKWGFPVRVELQRGIDPKFKNFLLSSLEIQEEDAVDLSENNIYEIAGPLDLTMMMSFMKVKGFDNLKDKPLVPQPSKDLFEAGNMFDVIKERDIVIHHPYETFDHVVDFVGIAANDPNVLAIKQTLYRVSGDSPIVKNLIQAAENGKQVTVIVEIKARFDEENNILWARKLEKAGCHVVYGLVGLKTHCKVLLVVRKEEDGIRRYVHLGTGNYNDSTAKLYTDIGMFTSKETFGDDVSALFNLLTGFSKPPRWKKLAVAPLKFREFFIHHIENEISRVKEGKEGRIIVKVNSIVDTEIIKALYKASSAGVKIELIVRGICCIRSGIEGVSKNITVRSIVGRFLEHSRIFYFHNGGDEKVFVGSADWMQRNLDRRVEVIFPVEDDDAKAKIIDILEISLQDTVKARVQQKDGRYTRIDRRGKQTLVSQDVFVKRAKDDIKAIVEQKEKMKIYQPVVKNNI